jgi:TRAP-type C4-dicarboxylate transport system permease small subunit
VAIPRRTSGRGDHGRGTAATAEDDVISSPPPPAPGLPVGVIARLERAMHAINRIVSIPCMVALVVAAAVLTYSVVARYFLKIPTDWQDETAAFLLVGATFLSGAFVQEGRGHVAIEVMAPLLSPRLNRVRLVVADVVSFAFCGFFAWKSWTLLHEAWVDGQRSNSSFGPPLSIPYGLMAVGMTLLSLQLLIGLVTSAARLPPRMPG